MKHKDIATEGSTALRINDSAYGTRVCRLADIGNCRRSSWSIEVLILDKGNMAVGIIEE